MDRTTYELIENYMLSCMKDSAHDKGKGIHFLMVDKDIQLHKF